MRDMESIIERVAKSRGTDADTLISAARGPNRIAKVRHLAMLKCSEEGYSFTEIAVHFDRTPGLVRWACNWAKRRIAEI